MEAAVCAVAAVGVGTVGVASFANAKGACRRSPARLERGDGDGLVAPSAPLSAYLSVSDSSGGLGRKNYAILSEGVLMVGREATNVTEPVAALGGQKIQQKDFEVTIQAERPKPVVLTFDNEGEAQTWARELQQWQTSMQGALASDLRARGAVLRSPNDFLSARIAAMSNVIVNKESQIMSLNERVAETKRNREEQEDLKKREEQAKLITESQTTKIVALENALKMLSEKAKDSVVQTSQFQQKLARVQAPADDQETAAFGEMHEQFRAIAADDQAMGVLMEALADNAKAIGNSPPVPSLRAIHGGPAPMVYAAPSDNGSRQAAEKAPPAAAAAPGVNPETAAALTKIEAALNGMLKQSETNFGQTSQLQVAVLEALTTEPPEGHDSRCFAAGDLVSVWSSSQQRWYDDGTVFSVNADGITAQYNGGEKTKILPNGELGKNVRRLPGTSSAAPSPSAARAGDQRLAAEAAELRAQLATVSEQLRAATAPSPNAAGAGDQQLAAEAAELRAQLATVSEQLRGSTSDQAALRTQLSQLGVERNNLQAQVTTAAAQAAASPAPSADTGFAAGDGVSVWSSSQQRWYDDGTVHSVDADGLTVQYNGKAKTKLLPHADNNKNVRRLPGTPAAAPSLSAAGAGDQRLAAEAADLRAQLATTSEQLRASTGDQAALRTQLSQIGVERDNLQAQVHAAAARAAAPAAPSADAGAVEQQLAVALAEKEALVRDQEAINLQIGHANAGKAAAEDRASVAEKSLAGMGAVMQKHEEALVDVRMQVTVEHQQHLAELQKANSDERTKTEELQKHLQEQEQLVRQEKAAVEQLKEKVTVAEESARQRLQQLQSLERSAAEGQQDAGLAQRLQEAEAQLQREGAQVSDLKGKLAGAKEMEQQQAQQVSQLQQNVAQKELEQQQAQRAAAMKANQLEADLDQVNLTKSSLTQNFEVAQANVDALQQKLDASNRSAAQKDAEIRQLKGSSAQAAETSALVAQQSDQIQRLETALRDSHTRAEDSARHLTELQTIQQGGNTLAEGEKQDLLRRVAELQGSTDVLADDKQNLTVKLGEAQSKADQLTKEFETEYVGLRRSVNDAERKKEKAEERAKAMEDQLAPAQAAAQQAAKAAADAAERTRNAEDAQARMERQLTERTRNAEDAKARAEQELAQMKDNMANNDQQSTTQSAAADAAMRTRNAEDAKARAEQELAQMKDVKAKNDQVLQQHEETNTRLRAERDDAREQLAAAQNATDADATAQNAQQKLIALEQENADLKSKLVGGTAPGGVRRTRTATEEAAAARSTRPGLTMPRPATTATSAPIRASAAATAAQAVASGRLTPTSGSLRANAAATAAQTGPAPVRQAPPAVTTPGATPTTTPGRVPSAVTAPGAVPTTTPGRGVTARTPLSQPKVGGVPSARTAGAPGAPGARLAPALGASARPRPGTGSGVQAPLARPRTGA